VRYLLANGVFVDQGPHFGNPPVLKPVEDVLRERHSPTRRFEAEKSISRSALEEESAGDHVVVGDQDLRDELQVRCRSGITFQHRPIVAETQPNSVVDDVVAHELSECVPHGRSFKHAE